MPERSAPQWRRNLIAAWFSQVLSLAGFGFVFPFLPFYIQELGVTDPGDIRFWTGVISAAPAITMGIMAPIWGIVADRVGRKLMLLRAMLGGMIIIYAMSRVQTVQALVVIRVIQGTVSGTMTASATLIASGTPRDRLSSALGFLASSNFIGISLGPLIGGVVSEYIGYRPAFIVGAGLLFLGFCAVLVFIREYRIEGDDEGAVETSTNGDSGGSAGGQSSFTLKSLMQPLFLLLFVLVFMLRFARTFPIPFIPLLVQEMRGTIEGSVAITGVVSALRGAATAAAGVTLSRLGDRRPKLRLITLFLVLAALTSLPIYFTPGLWMFVALNVVSTYFLGGVEPLVQSSLTERTPSSKRGLLFGVVTTVSTFGWFLAPLAGSLVSIRLSIRHTFLFTSVWLVMMAGVAWILARSVTKQRALRPLAR